MVGVAVIFTTEPEAQVCCPPAGFVVPPPSGFERIVSSYVSRAGLTVMVKSQEFLHPVSLFVTV